MGFMESPHAGISLLTSSLPHHLDLGHLCCPGATAPIAGSAKLHLSGERGGGEVGPSRSSAAPSQVSLS